ncbi:MAG: tRNA uridine-5-carboxymethylaminomethyl(34) synthesis GTPase MnmE [Candidatus Omnitrophota bacterium]
MYQYKGLEDTIAAIVTPSGTGGIGVVRLSGRDSLRILEGFFTGHAGVAPGGWGTFTVHHGWIRNPAGDLLDEVLVTLMRAPKSYTCEDVVEISCHGGSAAVRAVLESCLAHGARLAQPGEFTKRAFLNGRIDLAQAEAVLDVINARTQAALRVSERQLKGDFSAELEDLRARLLVVLADIEAVLNFPEDDTQAQQDDKLSRHLLEVRARLALFLATAQSGRVLKEGIKVVICGKPNVGKSSLLNALLRVPRAIVTDVAGTTRDVLEELANIDGVPVNLVDTAGILLPRDKVEEEAVRRSRASVESADIVLLVLDQSQPLQEMDCALLAQMKNPHTIVILNKSDLLENWDTQSLNIIDQKTLCVPVFVKVSALTRQGLDVLKNEMLKMALGTAGCETGGLVINEMRHVQALQRADEALGRVSGEVSLEFAAEDIKMAINELDAITGRYVDDDVIDHIFSNFCIGK